MRLRGQIFGVGGGGPVAGFRTFPSDDRSITVESATMEPLKAAGIALSALLWLWSVFLLLKNKREPTSTLAWALFVTSVPLAGPFIFLVLGPQRLERKAARRKRRLQGLPVVTLQEAETHRLEAGPLPPLSETERGILRLARQISDYQATGGNQVELIANPAEGLRAMREAVQKARYYVHLEYYIIATDEATRELFDDLVEAAGRGVEVRILYDAFGSLSLKRLTLRRLIKAGIQVAGFLPFSPLPQHINPHFRNHRKILVVDGELAFTGGANIGKEYLGRPWKKQWRDHFLRIRGPACAQLQEVFAKDWLFTTREDLFGEKYLVVPEPAGNCVVQVLDSGPDTEFEVLHYAIFLALNSAEREILLTTPYFIPDRAISASLAVAALRGVRVQLLLPAKNDAPLVRLASRSFYDRLLMAGVEIYEYQPTILHAKMLCIDGKWSIFGSANMDIRSFRLNFELNVFVFGGDITTRAAECFHGDRLNSRQIDPAVFRRRPLRVQMVENAARMLSPIL